MPHGLLDFQSFFECFFDFTRPLLLLLLLTLPPPLLLLLLFLLLLLSFSFSSSSSPSSSSSSSSSSCTSFFFYSSCAPLSSPLLPLSPVSPYHPSLGARYCRTARLWVPIICMVSAFAIFLLSPYHTRLIDPRYLYSLCFRYLFIVAVPTPSGAPLFV